MGNLQSGSLKLPKFSNLIQKVEFDSGLSLKTKKTSHSNKNNFPRITKQIVLEKLGEFTTLFMTKVVLSF